jgi:putative ABC transport system permease protein
VTLNYRQSIFTAIRSLQTNPLRSILTMLGIIIGVAAVIAVVAVGSGARAQVAERIQNLGASLLVVVPGAQSSGGARLGAGTRHTLTEDDATSIEIEIAIVEHAAPKVHGLAQVIHGNRNWGTVVNGVTDEFFAALDWGFTGGGPFTPEEAVNAGKVAVIGTTVAENLFGNADPLGRRVRIRNVPFEVVGLLESKGHNLGGDDMDDNVYVPLSTARLRLFGGRHKVARRSLDAIIVDVSGPLEMASAAAEIRDLLRQRHQLRSDRPDDFAVLDISSVQEAHRQASRTMSILLLAVASVSLLVGGISIMNIMLVSITERTREIGLRLAVGAKRRDIRNQFLIEAVTLALIGGTIGVLVGLSAAVVMAVVGGWPVLIGPQTIFLAFLFAAAVGLLSGLYPARRASLLEPVEALRFE